MDIRHLRRTARLTQLELARSARIDRTRLSFAECGYVVLTPDEEEAIKRAVLVSVEGHQARIREVLAYEK